MRGHRADQLAAEVVIGLGRQRHRVHLERRVRLLQRQQAAGVPDHVGVGYGGAELDDAWVREARVAEGAGQTFALGMLQLPFGCAHPAVAVGHASVLQLEGMQHAVAREPVVGPAWRELRVRAVAIQPAVQLLRQLAADRQVRRLALHLQRGVLTAQEGFVGREGLGHRYSWWVRCARNMFARNNDPYQGLHSDAIPKRCRSLAPESP